MLYFTRWKALAIILTALVVCLCAVPNFFPQERVKTWPAWAQRHIVLGLDLQGGSYLLLEVDSNYVKKEKLDQVRDEVRRVLREAKIHRISVSRPIDSFQVASASVSLLRADLWHILQTWRAAATSLRAGATLPSNGWSTSPNCSRAGAGAAITPNANSSKTSRKPRPPSKPGVTC